jgi:TolB-like protein
MKRRFFAVVLLFALLMLGVCCITAFAQTKPRLGILPFTGGSGGDGETVATLFSFQSIIQETFTIVPRTSAVNALIAEHDFQMTGYTDSDTIAGIGKLLNADYVVSGHIRRLGDRNLIITTIINVETFEQLTGDYREYRNIEEVRNLLPEISKKMITATQRDTSKLPKLAIAPFNIANKGVNVQDAEALAQILAIEIINTNKFAVLPRTTTMQTALKELEFQISGYTAEEGAKALGRAINAVYVLSAEVRSLGSENMFIGQILNVEDGSLLAGADRKYRVIDDGIKLMPELAMLLTDRAGAAAQIAARNREMAHNAFWNDPSRFWSIGVAAGTTFADPFVTGTIQGTIAPFKNSFLKIGCDLGLISKIDKADYYSVYPFAYYALFIPFAKKGGFHIGAGGGYMVADYRFNDLTLSKKIFAAELAAGINIANFLDIIYTFRSDFESASNKLMIGYSYRF